MKIEVFSRRRLRKRWYFRIVADNGEIVAQSEAYTSAQAAFDTVYLLRDDMRHAQVVQA